MSSLTVSSTTFFEDQALLDIDRVLLTGSTLPFAASFGASQFGPGLIETALLIEVSAAPAAIFQVNLGALNVFSAAGFGFQGWTQTNVLVLTGNSGSNTIIGSSQGDRINNARLIGGSGGLDSLFGGAGNDVISMNAQPDAGSRFDGGAGIDVVAIGGLLDEADLRSVNLVSIETLRFSASGQVMIVAGDQIGPGAIQSVSLIGDAPNGAFLTVVGTDVNLAQMVFEGETGDFTLRIEGQAFAANSLRGSYLAETLVGGSLADIFEGRGRADTMLGDAGNDIFIFDTGALVEGESISGGAGTDTLRYLGNGDLDLTATAMASVERVDIIDHGVRILGHSALICPQVATINGSTGGDALEVATRLIPLGIGGFIPIAINLSGMTFEAWTNGQDTITLRGSGFTDTITGSNRRDHIDGGANADTMAGGLGDDTYVVDRLADVVVEVAGGGRDTVRTNSSWVMGAAAQVEVLRADVAGTLGALALTGNAFGQTIVGNAGANRLDGQGGNDVLRGLGGDDVFVFSTTLGAGNVDRMFDFVPGRDSVELHAAVFFGQEAGALQAGSFVANTTGSATAAEHRIIHNTADGFLYFDQDGQGGHARVRFAVVDVGTGLNEADFLVV